MRKRVFSVPAIISLVLMAAVVVFWQRSYRVRDSMVYRWGTNAVGKIELGSANGDLAFIWQRSNSPTCFEWSREDSLNFWPRWHGGFAVRSEHVPIDIMPDGWSPLAMSGNGPRLGGFQKN